jgi:lipid A 3-O-deacylase
MRNRLLVAAITIIVFGSLSQPAAADIEKTNADTLTVGAGAFDVIENHPINPAFDYRLEYRSGYSLLANWTEPYVSIRPFGGFEGTSDGAAYGLGGFLFDIPLGKHFFITESEGVGLFDSGDGKDMGSSIEFRSQLEAGYKFDNQSRVSIAINHISNAGISQRNPGEESAVAYYSLPIDWLMNSGKDKTENGK